MAGVKGRSGGARQNSGGARPGAGRKKAPAIVVPQSVVQVVPGEPVDPRPLLERIALGHLEVSPQQLKALTALLPYVHAKRGEGGKKDAKTELAKKAGGGKFAPSAPPLKLVGNR